MSNDITTLAAKLKGLEQNDSGMFEMSDDLICEVVEALEGYKAAYEEEARDKEVQRSVIDDALCKLLPGCQYMDPPDGGSVTPLEQVSRMVEEYRHRIVELESAATHRWKEDCESGSADAGIKLQIKE